MLLFVLILNQGFILAQEDGDDIAIGKYRVLHSEVLDEDRLLYIHLPRDYEETQLSYPVLYLLYADIYNYYLDVASITEKLGSTGEIPPVIIVGVANTNRYRDLLPVKIGGREDSGGADNFLEFVEGELIPFIDNNYRTKNFRILAGPQAAAVFSLYSLITKPMLFSAIISENPFMNPENAAFLFPEAESFFKNTKSLKNFLYIKCEKDERPQDLEYVENFARLLESQTPNGFRFKVDIQEPSGYFIAPLPFREGLRMLFNGHKLPENFRSITVNDIIGYYEKLSEVYGFEVDPPSLMLTFEGDKLSEQRKTREAIALFDYQLILYPKSLNALMRLGEIYRGMGDFERARQYYKEFLDIQDRDAAMIWDRLNMVEKIIKESAAYRIEQEIEKNGIEAGLKKFRDMKSDPGNKLYFEENEFNAMAYRLMGKGKIKEALEIFILNVELHPNSPNVYDSLGEAYMNSGDTKNAIKNYKKSLELNPDNDNAREMLKKLEKKPGVSPTQATGPMSNQEIEAVETLVQVENCRLNFQVIEGGSLTILLESGGGMDSREWNRLAPELARQTGATIVSYDRAGFGKSDLPETPHDMREEVEWLWQGLQKLELQKDLILVGHSFGGWMIRLFASEHPEVVRGMVFVDPFTNELVDLLGLKYLDNHTLAGKIPFDTSQPDKLTKFQRAVVRMVGGGLSPKMEIMRKTKLPSDIPVVVITSGRPFLPKTEDQEAWRLSHEQLTASIKGAILVVAEKSDHMVPGRQPDLVIEAVMKVIDSEKKHFPDLTEKYFGQKAPGMKAELFTPEFISLEGRHEFALSFSPAGDELLFSTQVLERPACVFYTKIADGKWTKPKQVSLSKGAKKEEMEAFFSWDGRYIFFAPYDEGLDVRIWKVDIHEDGWHHPEPLAGQISNDSAFFPTSTKKGTLYYSNITQRKIYKALLENGVVQKSGEAGLEFEGHGFIAPDESFILVDSIQDEGYGKQDIYVAFRNEDGGWSKPVNLGNEVNTEYFETCPTLSSDEKYLFFSRYDEPGEISNIYWIDSHAIEEARKAIDTRLRKPVDDFPVLKGPYLGQKPPGMTPEIFAPGIVSTEEYREFSGTFTPDGKEYYFFRFADGAGMMVCKLLNEGWAAPKPASFNTEYIENEPHIAPDGKIMFFNSNRPFPGSTEERRPTQIWFMERSGDSWGEPKHLCEGMFATASKNGNIYLNSGITRLENGKFTPFREIEGALNAPPTGWKRGNHSSIALDESFLIYDSQRLAGEWDSDENLFICFRTKDGTWIESFDLGSKLDLPGGKMLATISPDNKYLFFCNRGDIYWVDAKIIEGLKSKELK